jgi:hypothetical protein
MVGNDIVVPQEVAMGRRVTGKVERTSVEQKADAGAARERANGAAGKANAVWAGDIADVRKLLNDGDARS